MQKTFDYRNSPAIGAENSRNHRTDQNDGYSGDVFTLLKYVMTSLHLIVRPYVHESSTENTYIRFVLSAMVKIRSQLDDRRWNGILTGVSSECKYTGFVDE